MNFHPFPTPDGRYNFQFDWDIAPDLSGWVTGRLAPVMHAWYPQIVEMLSSRGFSAPDEVRVVLMRLRISTFFLVKKIG
jgi:hypothetical protein